jgi:hypothetical protein
MTAEERILEAKRKKDSHDPIRLKRARITAIVLASATIISLVFLVYAFIQKEEANKLRQELELTRTQLQECQSAH